MVVVITGASGWIGGRLFRSLQQSGVEVRAYPREGTHDEQAACLAGATHLVHLAALVHQMKRKPTLKAFRKANVEFTLDLAQRAAQAGIKHFVFCSTAKVMGDTSTRPFTENDPPNPPDDYARSKWAAEQGLKQLQENGELANMKITVLRPPLVYGEGMGANAAALFRLANSPWPLPLGCANAPRSMISIEKLLFAVKGVIERQKQEDAYEDFFVCESPDRSVAEVIKDVRTTAGRSAGLFSVPDYCFKWLFKAVGKSDYYSRIFSPLRFSSEKFDSSYG
jgi:nucleoside-diphosphate-sugar epimerase